MALATGASYQQTPIIIILSIRIHHFRGVASITAYIYVTIHTFHSVQCFIIVFICIINNSNNNSTYSKMCMWISPSKIVTSMCAYAITYKCLQGSKRQMLLAKPITLQIHRIILCINTLINCIISINTFNKLLLLNSILENYLVKWWCNWELIWMCIYLRLLWLILV